MSRILNRRQCLRALKKLGFLLANNRSGKHDKLLPPHSLQHHNPPFIMLPRHRELHCQNAILDELKKMGGDKMVEDFLKYL